MWACLHACTSRPDEGSPFPKSASMYEGNFTTNYVLSHARSKWTFLRTASMISFYKLRPHGKQPREPRSSNLESCFWPWEPQSSNFESCFWPRARALSHLKPPHQGPGDYVPNHGGRKGENVYGHPTQPWAGWPTFPYWRSWHDPRCLREPYGSHWSHGHIQPQPWHPHPSPKSPPAQSRPLPRKLEHILFQKAYLGNKLHRAQYHLSYCQICEDADSVPLGLRLERKYNPIELDTPSSTKAQIEQVLKRTERGIQNILVEHYKNILPDLQEELLRLESRLEEIDQHQETSLADKPLKLGRRRREDVGHPAPGWDGCPYTFSPFLSPWLGT